MHTLTPFVSQSLRLSLLSVCLLCLPMENGTQFNDLTESRKQNRDLCIYNDTNNLNNSRKWSTLHGKMSCTKRLCVRKRERKRVLAIEKRNKSPSCRNAKCANRVRFEVFFAMFNNVMRKLTDWKNYYSWNVQPTQTTTCVNGIKTNER